VSPYIEFAEVGVDFNSTSGSGRLRTSPAMSPEAWPAVVLGKWVRAVDGEGNSCLAKVVVIHQSSAELEPAWGTWISGDEDTASQPIETPNWKGFVLTGSGDLRQFDREYAGSASDSLRLAMTQ
jgi:hypothetical protein